MRRVLVDPWITRIGGWSPERTYHTEGWNLGQAPWWVGGDPGDWPDLVVMPHVVISHAQIMKPQLKTRDTEGQWSFLCSSVNTLMCCYGYVPWFHKECRSSAFPPRPYLIFHVSSFRWSSFECFIIKLIIRASLVAQMVKVSTYNAGDLGFHPWVCKIPWRRKWHPTPVL